MDEQKKDAEFAITARLKALLEAGLYKSGRAMALAAGLNEVTFNYALKGADIRFSTLEAILKANPTISSEWLMRGEGDMFRDLTPPKEDKGKEVVVVNSDDSLRLVTNGGQISDNCTFGTVNEIVLEQLRQEVTLLREQISRKDAIIERMVTMMTGKN